MATYNGHQFIASQIQSILNQLSCDDEIIVVDDFSSDNTVNLINDFKDSRIKIFNSKTNFGHVKAFNKAISLSKNEFIFLSDQDDVWVDGRVSKMLQGLLNNRKSLVTSNFGFIDEEGFDIYCKFQPIESAKSTRHLSNIIKIFLGKINYYGCAMAFDRSVAKIAIPIPRYVESHDLWIAMVGNILGSNLHIDDKTILRRMHSNNVTDFNRTLTKKIYSRLVFLISLLHINYRIYIESKVKLLLKYDK